MIQNSPITAAHCAVIVNDDPIQLNHFSALLTRRQMTVAGFETVESALRVLKYSGPRKSDRVLI
jgi:DNA-binding NtrC family response regulator